MNIPHLSCATRQQLRHGRGARLLVPGTQLLQRTLANDATAGESTSRPRTTQGNARRTDDINKVEKPETKLPSKFIDAHHHFFDPEHNKFNAFLKTLGAPSYLPEQYKSDVIDPLSSDLNVQVEGTVHVEAIADNGADEARWVQSLIDTKRCEYVKAIVGSCDLTSPDVDAKLEELKASSSKVRGVRWILDCVGKFDNGKSATHVATKRHDGIDYLRGSKGGYDGEVLPSFEAGFSLLAKHVLSFDLQCAPVQLEQAAKLCKRHEEVAVCIDHMGKPRTVLGDDDLNNKNIIPSEEELRVWRRGMQAMAELPLVHVKISMLGYILPGWIRTTEREQVLRDLVHETVDLFGPNCCMVATNYHVSDALSDSDGLSEVGPTPTQLYRKLSNWFEDYSEDEQHSLFYESAKNFYRI